MQNMEMPCKIDEFTRVLTRYWFIFRLLLIFSWLVTLLKPLESRAQARSIIRLSLFMGILSLIL